MRSAWSWSSASGSRGPRQTGWTRSGRLCWRPWKNLAGGDIDPDLVDAAFLKMAYHREIKGMEPLKRMYQVIQSGWLYGGDPLEFLRADDLIAACRKACDEDPGILNRMIRERLVENPHRLDVVLRPDREWQARHNRAFQKEMSRLRSGKSDEAMRGIAREAERLQRDAGTPNSPEALATLPQLKLGDLPRQPVHIPTSVDSLPGERPFLTNDVFANGVNYLQLHVSLEGLPEELWPWLPRYLETFNKLGAAGQSYDQIARRRARDTGALSAHHVLDTHLSGPDRPAWGVRYSLKALDEQVEPALSLSSRPSFFPRARRQGPVPRCDRPDPRVVEERSRGRGTGHRRPPRGAGAQPGSLARQPDARTPGVPSHREPPRPV